MKNDFFTNVLRVKEKWALWNKMIKRTLYDNPIIYPVGAMAEDATLFIQLLYFASSVSYLDSQDYYYYYENNQSITKADGENSICHRFKQSVDNASILLEFCKKYNLLNEYHYELDSILLNKKDLITPLIDKKKYQSIWYNTFPELNYRVFLNPQITLKKKILHLRNLLKCLL